MSIDYCAWCERVAMDEGSTELKTYADGTTYLACAACDEEITHLSEDDPRKD